MPAFREKGGTYAQEDFIDPSTYYIFQRAFLNIFRKKNKKKNFLIPVHRIIVFSSCLLVMMLLTKCLPVVLIPKQLLVTAMRNDMIDHSCFRVPRRRLPQTFRTQRMRPEERFTGLLPSSSISAGTCAPYHFRMHLQMFRAVQLSWLD